LELRRDAVALALGQAESLARAGQQSAAVAAYRQAFTAARDVDQVRLIAGKLRERGVEVNLPDHFGFIMRWKVIGPFDNTAGIGFDTVYPPEREVDLDGIYQGKTGKVRWFDHVTRDPYGIVDLNGVFGRPKSPDGSKYLDSPEALRQHKGVIAYAYTEFFCERQRDVELRLGCINGSKLWLNGELVMANHVYHTAMAVDQYVGKGRLEKGSNTILVKIAQNEQPESWAQNWRFQLRVCDQYGTAVLSTDGPRTGLRSPNPPSRAVRAASAPHISEGSP
jgi:hypothetical protein